MNKYLISYIVFLFPLIAFAQTSSSTTYFNAVVKNTESTFLSFPQFEEANFNPFYIDELELRTQTDEFALRRQQYTLRMRPGNYRIPKIQGILNKQYQQRAQLSNDRNKEENLIQAYKLYLNFALYNQELAFERKKIPLLEDFITVYLKQRNENGFNVIDLLEAEDEVDKAELSVFELSERIINIRSIIENDTDTKAEFSQEDFISVAQITNILDQSEGLELNSIAEQLLALDKRIIQNEISLEKAETKSILDYVQFRYRGPHDDGFEEKLSVGIGLSIPYKKANLLKINELLLENAEEDIEYQNEILENNEEVILIEDELIQKINIYKLILDQNISALERNKNLRNRLQSSAALSPLVLLEIELLKQEKEGRLLEAQMEVYETYLEWLIATGKIVKLPMLNYLSKERAELTYSSSFWN